MIKPLCIEPMKINKIPEGKESLFPSICASGDYFAQLKKDGYWYQFEKTEDASYLWSRNISVSTGMLTEKGANVPHIMEIMNRVPAGTIIIGEIYYPGKRSKDVTPIMGSLPDKAIERQNGSYGLLHYYIHDMIYYNGKDLMNYGASIRYSLLAACYSKYSLSDLRDTNDFPIIELAERVEDNIQEVIAAALSAGEEGMVLKKKTAPYTPGKRPVWDTIKIKKTDTCDAVIMGTEAATIAYDGKLDLGYNYSGKDAKEWPYWAVYIREKPSDPFTKLDHRVPIDEYEVIKGINYSTRPITKAAYYGWDTAIRIGAYDGDKLVSIGTVSSGLTDDDKAHLKSYIGKVCELAGMEKDHAAHTLRHFHFKRIRDDKDPKECTLTSIFG